MTTPKNTADLSPASFELFMMYAQDACNWGGSPWVSGNFDITKAQRGNLADLVKKDYLSIQDSEMRGKARDMYVQFSLKGAELAVANGVSIRSWDGFEALAATQAEDLAKAAAAATAPEPPKTEEKKTVGEQWSDHAAKAYDALHNLAEMARGMVDEADEDEDDLESLDDDELEQVNSIREMADQLEAALEATEGAEDVDFDAVAAMVSKCRGL